MKESILNRLIDPRDRPGEVRRRRERQQQARARGSPGSDETAPEGDDTEVVEPVLDRASEERRRRDPVRLLENIRRDVEDLLNTRNSLGPEIADRYPEAARSVFAYGLPDADDIWVSGKASVEELRERMEETVHIHEPRIRSVRVHVLEAPRPLTHEVVLAINAVIRVGSAEEKVVWNSILRDGRIEVAPG